MTNGMLAAGKTLVAESGEKLKVAELFGSGGQGEVYRVQTPTGDRAVKWYYPQLADARQRTILGSSRLARMLISVTNCRRPCSLALNSERRSLSATGRRESNSSAA